MYLQRYMPWYETRLVKKSFPGRAEVQKRKERMAKRARPDGWAEVRGEEGMLNTSTYDTEVLKVVGLEAGATVVADEHEAGIYHVNCEVHYGAQVPGARPPLGSVCIRLQEDGDEDDPDDEGTVRFDDSANLAQWLAIPVPPSTAGFHGRLGLQTNLGDLVCAADEETGLVTVTHRRDEDFRMAFTVPVSYLEQRGLGAAM
jgi:hypothetical protein